MGSEVVVFRRVLIFRRVAAANVTANKTESQVHPAVARFQTLLAAARMGLHIPDLIQMSALCHALVSFLLLIGIRI